MAKKQPSLPGMEPPSHKAVDKAAEAVNDIDAKMKSLREKRKKAMSGLIAAMRKHKVPSYRDRSVVPNLVVDLSSVDKVKIKQVDPDPGDHDDAKGDDKEQARDEK